MIPGAARYPDADRPSPWGTTAPGDLLGRYLAGRVAVLSDGGEVEVDRCPCCAREAS